MKFRTTRFLGIIGIIGAPWMFIDFVNNGLYEHFIVTTMSGVRDVLFVTGWLSSVIGLYRLEASGSKRWQKAILVTQLFLLSLALLWSVMVIIKPDSTSAVFFVLNLSWPFGGCFMIVTGIVIIMAKKIKRWKRFVPLLAGLWFPQTLLIYLVIPNSVVLVLISGVYSAIVFSLLGFIIATANDDSSARRTSYVS